MLPPTELGWEQAPITYHFPLCYHPVTRPGTPDLEAPLQSVTRELFILTAAAECLTDTVFWETSRSVQILPQAHVSKQSQHLNARGFLFPFPNIKI